MWLYWENCQKIMIKFYYFLINLILQLLQIKPLNYAIKF